MVMSAFCARSCIEEGAASAPTSHVERPKVPVFSLLCGMAAHWINLYKAVEISVASSSTGTPL
eukprot:2908473-Amphidinium_carterae.1